MRDLTDPTRRWLRLEAVAATAAGLAVWSGLDGGWWRFAAFFLIPDISLLGYFGGSRIGAAIYNLAHTYTIPVLLGVAGGVLDQRSLLLASAIWLTHIGVDRALGYGLKYPTGFRDTHLGQIGTQPVPYTLQRTGEQLIELLHQQDAAHPNSNQASAR